MPGKPTVTDVSYRYDGTFPGFLCCVFESFERRELPAAVLSPEEGQLTLFGVREISSDSAKARRVYAALDRQGEAVKYRLMTGFLNTDPGKDLVLLRFARLGFTVGPKAAQMLADEDGAAAFALERAVSHEACLMKEFIRFEQRGDTLGAVIHPRHCVLPLLRAHFCNRLPDENFLIYDATHQTALLRRGDEAQYLTMTDFDATPDADEQDWQDLWKRFFDALTIRERINPRCQMNHCAKRFWRDMPEMRGV